MTAKESQAHAKYIAQKATDMQTRTTISMVTPTFNAAKTLERTINSILQQTVYCQEYIVVDGESTDETRSIVDRYRHVITHSICEPDTGIYDAMNKGILKARGEVVGIINADDILVPGALQIVSRCFEDLELDYLFSDVQYLDEHGGAISGYAADREAPSLKCRWHGRDWRFRPAFAHPGLFVRRRVYERLGLFDTSYRLAADHQFINRMLLSRAKGTFTISPLAIFSMGGRSSTQGQVFMENARVAVECGMSEPLALFNVARSWGGRVKSTALRRLRR